jgi:hypothetical protein
MTKSDQQKIKYEKRIFAFLDILGFEELVISSKDDPTIILQIYELLNNTSKMAQSLQRQRLTVLKTDLSQFIYHMFSDTITMSCPYKSHDDFVAMASWVMIYQYKMWAEKGKFIRGSMVYADVYENGDMLFGPAIIHAYHLEKDKDKAVWPRVLVDDSVLDFAENDERERAFAEFLRKDESGLVYLDYLKDLFAIFSTNQVSKQNEELSDPIKLFEDHKNRISEEMKNHEEQKDILEKYNYLIEYHNSSIDEQCEIIDQLINDKVFIRDFVASFLKEWRFKYKGVGSLYKSPYTAEDMKYVHKMPALGMAVIKVAYAEQNLVDFDNPEEAANIFCNEIPRHLAELHRLLIKSKITLKDSP